MIPYAVLILKSLQYKGLVTSEVTLNVVITATVLSVALTFRLPFMQYWMTRHTFGGSTHTPKNCTKFSCFISFICLEEVQMVRHTYLHTHSMNNKNKFTKDLQTYQ